MCPAEMRHDLEEVTTVCASPTQVPSGTVLSSVSRAAGREKGFTEGTSQARRRPPDRVTSRGRVGHRGCWLLFAAPRLQSPRLTPQQISEAPLDAHGPSQYTAQLELTRSFSRSLLHVPLAAGREPLPSEPLWTHLMGS